MTSPRATRHYAAIAIVVVWLLVCGGLGWATYSVLRLERHEQRDDRQLADIEARTHALSKLDAVVAPIRYRESARPYSHFRAEFKPTDVYGPDGADVGPGVLMASPLAEPPRPDWIVLHFKVTEGTSPFAGGPGVFDRWGSPQVPTFDESAMSAAEFPASERSAIATAQDWLAALRESQTLSTLLSDLEAAIERRPPGTDRKAESPPPAPERPTHEQLVGALTSSTGRIARLLQNYPADQCVSERVALENLDIGVPPGGVAVDQSGCVAVTCTPMEPIWLDATMDGHWQLAFVRTVHVASSASCAVQGVLIDWPRLRSVLEAEVLPFLPNARLVPVTPAWIPSRSESQAMMTTLPVLLETGESLLASGISDSGGFGVGLALAWAVTVAALIAITYGTWRYVTMAERRMRFVAAVTHELRTPLTTFQIYADLLADGPAADAATQRSRAETLRGESRRLARLVENVLAYSKMGRSTPKLSRQDLPPSALLDSVRAETSERCETAGKRLVVQDHCAPGTALQTDPEFVLQILSNLVDNACKYSADAADPCIWLDATAEPDGTITFDVEDAGQGVSHAARREIFRPFRRANTDGPGGMGLGLALSRYWAECLGGRLTLKRGARNGAHHNRFSLSLPRQAAPARKTRATLGDIQPHSG